MPTAFRARGSRGGKHRAARRAQNSNPIQGDDRRLGNDPVVLSQSPRAAPPPVPHEPPSAPPVATLALRAGFKPGFPMPPASLRSGHPSQPRPPSYPPSNQGKKAVLRNSRVVGDNVGTIRYEEQERDLNLVARGQRPLSRGQSDTKDVSQVKSLVAPPERSRSNPARVAHSRSQVERLEPLPIGAGPQRGKPTARRGRSRMLRHATQQPESAASSSTRAAEIAPRPQSCAGSRSHRQQSGSSSSCDTRKEERERSQYSYSSSESERVHRKVDLS